MIRETRLGAHTKTEIRGCIDLGSSYFRLLVVEGLFPGPGRLEPEDFVLRGSREDRRFVGWGKDLAESGTVSKEALRRAIRCLSDLLARAAEWRCPSPFIVGTNTLRESKNSVEIVSRLEDVSPGPVRVLSQDEEAARGYAGAALFRGRDERICLIDAGGTSTEISWGTGPAMEGCLGLPVGVHRLQVFLCPSSGARRAARALSDELVEWRGTRSAGDGGVYRLRARLGESTILATGGTAVSVAALLGYMRRRTPLFEEFDAVSLDELAWMRRRVRGLFCARRQRTLPLDANRTKLLEPGSILLEGLLSALGIGAVHVTARDLRWGIIVAGGAGAGSERAGE
jgi:exopolyphosphatase/guanosine-5'-triphosphate,3'-diphosphate pyrophosphatase